QVVVANEFGFPSQHIRFWIWAKRPNHTVRPHRPLTKEEEEQHVENLKEAPNNEVKLFLEVEFWLDLQPVSPPLKTKGNILLFFKLYDPKKEELRYAGRLFVKQTAAPMTILEKLNQMVGFSYDEEIELYEEIKFVPGVMCELVNKLVSFQESELQDGDILCFQKAPPDDGDKDCLLPDVPSFLERMHNRQIVCFRYLKRPHEDDFYLELSKVNSYDDVVETLAHRIGLDDPSKIRLTSHNNFSQQPNPVPITYRGVENLLSMLVNCNQTSNILYYEVLDIPLPQLQDLKCLRVAFYYSTKNQVVSYNIRMPNHSTVEDVINQFKTKLQLSPPDPNLRLIKVLDHKIYKIYSFDEIIEGINDQQTLRVIEIPEEKNLGPFDILIPVCHFFKEIGHKNRNQTTIKSFGEPFMLVIHERDTLAKVKVQIQSKLLVPAKEFYKWKFAFLSPDHPEYLQDSVVLSSRFQRKGVCSWDQILGLEHHVNDPRIIYALDQ
ncbi:Ubiquitin carboxyl-terminal hydrolase 7, ICP0-binding domain, partial [Sesbania bispinosa]